MCRNFEFTDERTNYLISVPLGTSFMGNGVFSLPLRVCAGIYLKVTVGFRCSFFSLQYMKNISFPPFFCLWVCIKDSKTYDFELNLKVVRIVLSIYILEGKKGGVDLARFFSQSQLISLLTSRKMIPWGCGEMWMNFWMGWGEGNEMTSFSVFCQDCRGREGSGESVL